MVLQQVQRLCEAEVVVAHPCLPHSPWASMTHWDSTGLPTTYKAMLSAGPEQARLVFSAYATWPEVW